MLMSSIPKTEAEDEKKEGEPELTGEGEEIGGLGELMKMVPRQNIEYRKGK